MNIPAAIGRYEIRGILGEGGMATVLEGWDPVLHRTLAIKLVDKAKLDPETKDEALRRFKREAQAAARLAHANVVQVYEYGEEGNYCFIAMEYVAGKPLTAYLSEGLKTELQRVRDIIGQLLDALAYSHAQGVVHRDGFACVLRLHAGDSGAGAGKALRGFQRSVKRGRLGKCLLRPLLCASHIGCDLFAILFIVIRKHFGF